MKMLDAPVYCLTTDTDWASDFALDRLFHLCAELDIRPTVFATHASPVLSEFVARGGDVGLHPNFLPGTTHGGSFPEVIEHIQGLYPQARSFRSHCAFDTTLVSHLMVARGIRYDSNLGLYLQPNLFPLRHESGLVRFPIFWEEDIHWHITGGDWDVDRYWPTFVTPGLKILNVHAFMIGTNCPNHEHYARIKSHIPTLSAASLSEVEHSGEGCRTFLMELLKRLRDAGHSFYTLSELYDRFPIQQFLSPGHPDLAGGSPRRSALAEDALRRN